MEGFGHGGLAGVVAVPPGEVEKGRKIGKRHVQSLRADGRHDMRRLGHQHGAGAGHPLGNLGNDRPDAAPGDEAERAEDAGGAGRHLGLEIGDGKRGEPGDLRAGFHPDHGGGGLAVAVGQGDEGEGAALAVDLGRDIAVGQVMRHRKGQRLLAVTGGFRTDPEGFAHRGVAAVGADHQSGGDLRPVGEGDEGLGLAGQHPGEAGAGAEADVRQFRNAGDHLAAEEPVRQVPAEGCVGDVGGVEIPGEAGFGFGAARVDDPHDLQGCGMRFQPRPEARGFQHGDRGLQEGGGAQVGPFGLALGDGGGRVDADHPEPGRAKRAGGGQARDAAAGDQNVGGFAHRGPPPASIGRAARRGQWDRTSQPRGLRGGRG